MEEEIVGGREHPPPPPPLLFLRGKNHNKMAFSLVGDLETRFSKEKPRELQNKSFQAYRNGWFILLDSYNSPHQFSKIYSYTLWNPSTSEFIHLPPLDLRGQKTIKSCTLSSPPGNPDCVLILFETQVPSIIFCRIGIEDKHWKHQNFEFQVFGEVDYLFGHVMLNGTLYSSTRRGRLVKLDLDCPNDRLGLTLLDDCCMPCSQEYAPTCARYMVEFCGESFLIYLVIKGLYNSACQVVDVEVFALDFSNMVWSEIRSFEEKAFFVGPYGSFSYSCTVSDNCGGIRGNHVYFTMPKDESLYSFNMGDKTVSVSFPCSSDLKSSMEKRKLSWCTPIWIMPDSSLATRVNNTKAKGDSHEGKQAAKSLEKREISKRARLDQVEGEFSKLPVELLIAISKILLPQDKMNFTTVITRLPPIPWNQLASELSSQDSNNSLKPWLMVLRKGDLKCNFTNLWGGKYSLEIHQDQLRNVTVACSKEGWSLMLRGENSIFFWNPLTNKTIHLPDMQHKRQQIFSFGFSFPIKKVVLMGSHLNGDIFIDYISLEEGEWNCFIPISAFPASSFTSNPMTFYRGAFHILNNNGDLFVHGEETGLKLLDVANKPFLSFHRTYLVECDGKLVLVIVGSLGEWVRIFHLDESDLVWFEVKDLGPYSLYVSRYSSLDIATDSGMENRVYFSRFYDKSVVYYSLRSGRLHVQDNDKVFGNIYNTKEQLLSTWIQRLGTCKIQ